MRTGLAVGVLIVVALFTMLTGSGLSVALTGQLLLLGGGLMVVSLVIAGCLLLLIIPPRR